MARQMRFVRIPEIVANSPAGWLLLKIFVRGPQKICTTLEPIGLVFEAHKGQGPFLCGFDRDGA